ncbi:hypothetical protein SERLA73DRAFT_150336 [Serpula lacrymans var. lacrymans S7.3]|uniref:Uncharacterized protein n=1 Tax=Serpula lacrymans var. lacrymans (strain S7.3) TaxID=936435 RepID=F8PM57_SERL3|nr:hypothetical protein SERLA73DRAFT_150336 [Serpula lacrymans var. lacrymans S7.3]
MAYYLIPGHKNPLLQSQWSMLAPCSKVTALFESHMNCKVCVDAHKGPFNCLQCQKTVNPQKLRRIFLPGGKSNTGDLTPLSGTGPQPTMFKQPISMYGKSKCYWRHTGKPSLSSGFTNSGRDLF